MAVITLDKVTKKYGRKTVLQDYSLQIQKGELLAVTGPSGCGKSTLLNIIGLLEGIDAGIVSINGYMNPKPATPLSNKILREQINYLFQSFALVDEATVENNLRIALDGQRGARKDKGRAIDEALERVGLSGFKKYKIFELSGGENRDIILDMIKEMNEQGKTILIVTHDPAVAGGCQRIVSFS